MTFVLAVIFGVVDVDGLIAAREFGLLLLSFGTALGIGVALAFVVSGVLPVLESLFQLTTDISWLELSDLNHKLLRRMQLEAPGTFHHSLVVASLSESAAEAVGANASMCRVCAYFHDIGKINKPEYFIENQLGGTENPHDSLTPTMSALIIVAHVKDGVDLALKHHLNPRVIDVIREHHGTSLVSYFYRRAQERKLAEQEKVEKKLEDPKDLPKIEEKNFRYPGPRPQTRESGIISLADAVESASRTLKKPTPGRIRALVDDLVEGRIRDGQLDDCDLTLRDVAQIKEVFSKTLRSMLHSRIDYPKEEGRKPGTSGGRSKKEAAKDEPEAGGKSPAPAAPPAINDAPSRTAGTEAENAPAATPVSREP
jgi:putative nucleotidyltransferase with HDIG domain